MKILSVVKVFVILTGCFLSACASMTGQTVGNMTLREGEASAISQTLDSSGFKIKMPAGWEVDSISAAEKEGQIVGKFINKSNSTTIIVSELGITPISGQRGFLDTIADNVFPNHTITEGPFVLGSSALSPFYIRYSGSLMAEGKMLPMDLLGGFNLARGFNTYIVYMVTPRMYLLDNRSDFLAVVNNF